MTDPENTPENTPDSTGEILDTPAAQRRYALNLLLDAWEAAFAAGCEPSQIASAALFVTLTDLVEQNGAEAVAEFIGGLPERIKQGEFTLSSES